jgi:hypothetical protein
MRKEYLVSWQAWLKKSDIATFDTLFHFPWAECMHTLVFLSLCWLLFSKGITVSGMYWEL